MSQESTRLMSLILIPGFLGWIAVFWNSRNVKSSLQNGSNWLMWRPLPFGLLPAVFLAISLGLIAQIALVSMLNAFVSASPPAVFMHLIAIMTFHVPAAVMAMAWFQRARIPLAQGLGLETGRGGRELAAGIGGYVLAFPAVVIAGAVTLFVFTRFGLEMSLQPTVLDLKQLQHPVEWLLVFLLVVMIGPFCEEVVFRGVLFPWLSHRLGLTAGLWLHSLIFALIHGHAASSFPLFVLSLFLGGIYMVRRNLMAAFWMHAVFNGVSLLNVYMAAIGDLP
ncbi:MAG: CPBP family intramembrane metalloprotease [Verrucomicrobia bacterium]|nr:CPBP family intramembrane metalloprotease [Verrucomicrobiota bacterium]